MNKIVSDNLKKFRLQKGLTQEQVAEKIGVNAQTISRWECNVTMPDITMLPQIARIYCVSIDDFFKNSSCPYENYAQKLADLYSTTKAPEDFILADTEFENLKIQGKYSLEDIRVHAGINQFMMQHCKNKAIKLYNELLEKADKRDRTYWRTRCAIIKMRALIGESENSVNEQLKTLERNAEDSMEWHVTLYAFLYANRFQEGYELYKKAVDKFTDNWDIYIIGGEICKKLYRYEEAIESWNKALEIEPNYLDAYYSKAFCYEEMGKYDAAYSEWCYIVKDLKDGGYEAKSEELKAKEIFKKAQK